MKYILTSRLKREEISRALRARANTFAKVGGIAHGRARVGLRVSLWKAIAFLQMRRWTLVWRRALWSRIVLINPKEVIESLEWSNWPIGTVLCILLKSLGIACSVGFVILGTSRLNGRTPRSSGLRHAAKLQRVSL